MNQSVPHNVQQFGTVQRDPQLRFGAWIRSNRFTLGFALVLAIALPELFHPAVNPAVREAGGALALIEPSTIVSIFALVGAHAILRRVGLLPLVDDKLLILPAFLSSYAAAYSVLAISLRSFSLFHLATSFAIGLAWYFFVAVMRARYSAPRLAIVGDLPESEDVLAERVKWVILRRPRIPRNVQGIVFNRRAEQGPSWERMFSRAVLRGIPLYELSHLREMMTGRVSLAGHPEEVFGQLLSQPYLRLKRMFDTVTAIVALIAVVPVLAVLCVIIQIDSPGPAIFRQSRIGHQGRRFTCYKLRTMHVNRLGPAYTTTADPRVTRIGKYLRKWRFDELPQVFNILKGEMSWIGPRPESLALARQYERAIPFYAYRHAVRPGISGWAAVHQGNVGMAEAATIKLEYDFYYLKNFSVWLDFVIVLMTIRTVVTGFGHR